MILPTIYNGDTMSYKRYLKTNHWQTTRFLIKATKRKCNLCGSKKNLNVHHKTYRNIGNESERDLLLVCKDCHNELHKRSLSNVSDQVRGRIRKLINLGYSKNDSFANATKSKNFDALAGKFKNVCAEISIPNVKPCVMFKSCLKNNKLKFITVNNCYVAEK